MDSAQAELTVVDVPEDCGNAPRKIVIRDFLIALYQRDVGAVLAALHDSVQWEIVGSCQLEGPSEVDAWLTQQPAATELHVALVITHGTDCGADGTVVYAKGSQVRFHHVLIFAGHSKTAKIKQLRSYLING